MGKWFSTIVADATLCPSWGCVASPCEFVLKASALATLLYIHGGIGLVNHVVEGVQGARIAADNTDTDGERWLLGEAPVMVHNVRQ